MARLRRTSPTQPGWSRRRAGKGFTYLDGDGKRLPDADAERIRSLAIPPAWNDVWICPHANGHLQAVGTDDAGRRQYLYHPDWRTKRDKAKFDRILDVAPKLGTARKRVSRDIAADGMPLERAAAVAVRLLDLGYFRIGSDAYTDANGSFGLTTLERRHVRKSGDSLIFRFTGKSGIEHTITIDDADAIAALETMRRRGADGDQLLAYSVERQWRPLVATDVNAYLADLLGGDLTSKDFRTWHATVIAAAALADSDEPGDTKASRRRAVKAAITEVAEYLGNTPAIAKKSYIDPRVLDRYDDGTVMKLPTFTKRTPPGRRQALLEKALRDLLG